MSNLKSLDRLFAGRHFLAGVGLMHGIRKGQFGLNRHTIQPLYRHIFDLPSGSL
jgi:hypothetical protein